MKQTPYKRIMVALDQSEMDKDLIAYAVWFAETMKAQKIYFVHFVKSLIIIKEEFLLHQDDTPLDEKIRASIENNVKQYTSGSQLEAEIVVQAEHPLEGLLNWQKIKNIDLVVVGKKMFSKGSGVISRQFVRQSSCPVLFVTDKAKTTIEKILVPIDFSENSGFALSHAIRMYPYLNQPEITCQHIYFSTVYSTRIKVNSQYPKYVYQSAIDKNKKFMALFELNDIQIKTVFTPEEGQDIVHDIKEYAESHKMDLIVIGAIGHSKIKLLTVGSTAEKMMLSYHRAPLLVVKK